MTCGEKAVLVLIIGLVAQILLDPWFRKIGPAIERWTKRR